MFAIAAIAVAVVLVLRISAILTIVTILIIIKIINKSIYVYHNHIVLNHQNYSYTQAPAPALRP